MAHFRIPLYSWKFETINSSDICSYYMNHNLGADVFEWKWAINCKTYEKNILKINKDCYRDWIWVSDPSILLSLSRRVVVISRSLPDLQYPRDLNLWLCHRPSHWQNSYQIWMKIINIKLCGIIFYESLLHIRDIFSWEAISCVTH